MIKLYPSLISANPLHLGAIIQALEPHCAGFHLDVMDNHFVPNLTFGANIVNELDAATEHPSWVHLMVERPEEWCDRLKLKEKSIVSFHIEATNNARNIVECLTEKKWIPSIAIKPQTSAAEVFTLLDIINHVLIMSVEPGFSGQRFIPNVMSKVQPLLDEAKKLNRSIMLGIDGGINRANIKMIAEAGIEDVAVASAIFSRDDVVKAIEELKRAAQ